MASAIDPSKPVDGVPASKADLRANLQTAKAELDHGGFAEGLSPLNYGPPASSMVKDHLAALDTALGGLSFSGDPSTVSVKAHAAAGDGVADDTAAIQVALNSGAAVVYFPPGTYRVTGQLTVSPGTKVVGAGAGRTIIDGSGATGLGGGNAILLCSGSTVSLPSLSSSIDKADGRIGYSASIASNLVHGDWVRIIDTTASSLHGSELDGFTCMVQSAEGSTLFPAQPALRTLPAPRTSGALSNVESTKLDGRGLVIEDLTVRGPGFDSTSGSSSVNGMAISTLFMANVYLTRVRVLGGGNNGVQFERSANCHVTDCDITIHNGDHPGGAMYGLNIRGSAYVYVHGSHLFSARHGVEHTPRLGPTHTTVISASTIAAPGTAIFQQPTTTSQSALGWHRGTYDTTVIGCHVQGCVTLRGEAMQILGCILENGGKDGANSPANQGMFDCFEFGPALDCRIQGNKVFLRKEIGSGNGLFFNCTGSDWQEDAGAIGSLVIADNDIYVMINSTTPLIGVVDTGVKNPTTGVIHVTNNRIGHCASSGVQPFLSIDVTDGIECVVTGNVLPNNVSLGTVSGFARTVTYPNVINGFINFAGLPTSTPSGSGRLWSDGGTLKVT